ncbi:hypothetical protein BJ878DRAFT_477623 [Calycina marina]|uniref:Uncharacterized protein n=1 Tax=Calycina marina TaxID=1763456 RepID=A0A9P8CHE7_9HELO|nr:hypothetical protein BJ878DRAFT_477623 [Calycina marina]
MADQKGTTPGSNGDTSVNGGRGSIKDKLCPFCSQNFTSSSLGRHLDLYIKEKNPKPADGMHDVDEIRKIRGGITRRQPRNSMSRREDSTPGGTPGAQDRRSPALEPEHPRSPSIRREPMETQGCGGRGTKFAMNKGSWENTGVINNIPLARNGDGLRSYNDEDRDFLRRMEPKNRSVSKQLLAKTTFDQKHKMADALDSARAAELALRELLGGLRAAKQHIEGTPIFDYDPLALDFPSLILHCLPPPPTLRQTHPMATSSSWSISPPGEAQYQALRAHFSAAIHDWRVSCAIATTAPREDFSYPRPDIFNPPEDPSEFAQRAEAAASELESEISEHLHQAFGQWNSLCVQQRTELWILELARSIGRKSDEVQKLKKEKEFIAQQAAHLKSQVEELSRLQHPREYNLMVPAAIPVESALMSTLAEAGTRQTSIGFDVMDRNLHLDAVVERAIGRWKGVVKEARGGAAGLHAQRSLSGESSTAKTSEYISRPVSSPNTGQPRNYVQSPKNIAPELQHHSADPDQLHIHNQHHSEPRFISNGHDMGSDPDADAEADMEEEVYIDMSNGSHVSRLSEGANFRLTNGSPNSSPMNGLENATCISGYVRIGG